MKNQNNDTYSLAHTTWKCQYHIVFTPKYHRKIIYGALREEIGKILRELCQRKEVEIIEAHAMPDHIHMLVSIPPNEKVSSFMGYLKGKSTMIIFERYAHMKYKIGNRHFWSRGYYVSTVGANKQAVQKYIQHQETEDLMERSRNGGELLRVACLVDDCLARGKAIDEGGAKYNHVMPTFVGVSNVVDKCIGCGVCRRVKPDTLEEKTRICAYGARKVYGREYTTKELLEIILLDKEYYASTGGGVTFSGGECMLQISFLTELASLCKQNGVSVAVDTAGCVPYGYFEQILPFVDLFLYDVKCIDGDLHKRGTGQDNGLILDNLNRLIKMGKKIVIRTPVIPHFNDNNELKHIESYCNERKLPVEFLPYHEYGIYKNQALQNRE